MSSSQEEPWEEEPQGLYEELNQSLESKDYEQILIILQVLKQHFYKNFTTVAIYIYQHMVSESQFEEAIRLINNFPDLLLSSYFQNTSSREELFEAISSGHELFFAYSLNCLGLAYQQLNKNGFNIFEYAVHFGHYEIMKLIHTKLGVTSDQEYLLLRAAKLGEINILKYLFEEINLKFKYGQAILKNAIKSGSLETVQYCIQIMNISNIDDPNVIELAVENAVKAENLDILQYLINYCEILFKPSRILPLGDPDTDIKHSLHRSLSNAIKQKKLCILKFCVEVLKIQLATDDLDSDYAHYLQLLQCAVQAGSFQCLRYLVESCGLEISNLPRWREDSLVITALNTNYDDKLKLKFLGYILQKESTENTRRLMLELSPEQIDYLNLARKKSRQRDSNGNSYKKHKNE